MGRQSNSKKAEVEVGGGGGTSEALSTPNSDKLRGGWGGKMMSQNNDEE